MKLWLVERYLASRLRIPGPLLQWALEVYVETRGRLALLWSRLAPGIPQPPARRERVIAVKSRELIATQYDLPRALFERFLGPSMKYSMALWERGATTLEEAQHAMLADLCDKAGIRDGERILDVGCGFGSFAGYVLQRFPRATVHGLNLSAVQCRYINDRRSERGHPLNTPRFGLIQADFNTVELVERYDRIVSIGFFEHVTNLEGALKKLHGWLHPEGRVLLHYIVFRRPLDRISERPREDPFLTSYIFPGGAIWFEQELLAHQRHLRVEAQWFLNGSNYRRTLEAWLANFWHNLDRIREETAIDDRFVKLWDLYLRACVAVFAAQRGTFFGNGQYRLAPVATGRRS
ncbi:MAG: class I SAM-dependent methyltransferase [Candidatus Lambdaproteobacteria bacterium]|nr:class I SAM-dependent methyltransferase [Candidatus Lambdaproteobacteria bacterium]